VAKILSMTEHPTNLIYFSGSSTELAAQVSKAPGLVVAIFSAAWCPPCQKLAAQLPSLAQQNPVVTFLKIDIDHCRELAAHYGINSIPHTRFLRPGPNGELEELVVVTGADLAQIQGKIRQLT
jgi:thioredoxin 1